MCWKNSKESGIIEAKNVSRRKGSALSNAIESQKR
jgi:hypothetical protein